MRALVIYCHPEPSSFTAAVRDAVLEELKAAGAETRMIDLYAEGFDPILSRAEWNGYFEAEADTTPVAAHVEAVRWADGLIFVYPTWWYGLPAMLKGWLERVMLPGVAFSLGESGLKPQLTHIRSLHIFTTCGASWWLTRLMGNIGRRTILRGFRPLCHPLARTSFLAHFRMDSATPESRRRHIEKARQRARKIARRNS